MVDKRTLAAVTLFMTIVLLAGGADPFRVGLEFGSPTAVIVIRPEPFDFKIGYDFADIGGRNADEKFIYLSADYRILSSYHLIEFLGLFISAGGFLQYFTGEDVKDELVLGGRIPVGLQAFLAEGLVEVFVELAPTVSLFPTPDAFDQWQGWIGFTIAIPSS